MQTIQFSKDNTAAEIECPGGCARLQWREGLLSVHLLYRAAFGMGEKYDRLNQKGHTVVNEVQEKFCFQGDKTYCPAPFFWTDSGFGLYVDTCEVTSFEFLDRQILVHMPNAPIFIFTGSPETMIREYMQLLGAAVLPPKWAFGVWISANRWHSQQEVEAQLNKLEQNGFPASVLVVEAWSDEATFYVWNGASYRPAPNGRGHKYEDFDFSDSLWPNPKGMIDTLHKAGVRLVLWQIPVYKKLGTDEARNCQNELDRENAVERQLCVQNADGTPYTIPEGHWFSGSLIPDFTNPETVASWFAKRQYLLDIGVDGFKTDGGEFVLSDSASFHDGSTGAEGRNRYPRDYTKAYLDFIGRNRVLFSRAGYSGQHTAPILWAGDQQSKSGELRSALLAGLSAAATGIPFWGFDIGGFAGPLPSANLYLRATQLACFCPIMQWHSEPDGGQFKELMAGCEGNNERSPWNIAEGKPELLTELRYWHLLRENLMPYLWQTAQECVRYNRPMLRPLAYYWPEDSKAISCEDEYLLGDKLLVAPYLNENAQKRSVYLPEGEWISLFSHTHYGGGRTVCSDCDGRLPVYMRSGAALPLLLGESLLLGSAVNEKAQLHFILAGEKGNDSYLDDAGNTFTVQWENGHAAIEGHSAENLTWEIV